MLFEKLHGSIVQPGFRLVIILPMARQGKIVAPTGLNIRTHEMATARALASAGFDVEFLVPSTGSHEKTPDIVIDGIEWEMKAPKGSNTKTIEKNLRRATEQSCNVVFDSGRMKSLPDRMIERELRVCSEGRIKKLARLLFINRHREVIDIK